VPPVVGFRLAWAALAVPAAAISSAMAASAAARICALSIQSPDLLNERNDGVPVSRPPTCDQGNLVEFRVAANVGSAVNGAACGSANAETSGERVALQRPPK
jgi:hypothetical protein